MGQRLGIAGDDGAGDFGLGQPLDDVGKARVEQDVPGPGAKGRGRLEEEEAQPVGLEDRVEILVETGPPSRPGGECRVPRRVDLGPDLVVHLAQHGLEQPGLVAEVMVQRAARQPGLGRDRVKRDLGKAPRREGRPRDGQQAVRRVLRHVGAAAAAG